MNDRIATTAARLESFYWVILGQNPPEIAYWERGEWWLAGDAKPWYPEAVTVVSDRLVFKPLIGAGGMSRDGARGHQPAAAGRMGGATGQGVACDLQQARPAQRHRAEASRRSDAGSAALDRAGRRMGMAAAAVRRERCSTTMP